MIELFGGGSLEVGGCGRDGCRFGSPVMVVAG